MDRKGSLEWNLETIGKLFIGAIVLVFIFLLIIAIIGIFKNEDDAQAKKNFELLTQRIDQVQKYELVDAEASLLFSLRPGYSLVVFDSKRPTIDYFADGGGSSVKIPFPGYCNKDDSCLCLLKKGSVVDCKNYPYAVIELSTFIPRGTVRSEYQASDFKRVLRGSLSDCSTPIGDMRIRVSKDRLELVCTNNQVAVPAAANGLCDVGTSPCSGVKINSIVSVRDNPSDPSSTTRYKCVLVDGFCKAQKDTTSVCKEVYEGTEKLTYSPCIGVQPPENVRVSDRAVVVCSPRSTSAEDISKGICKQEFVSSGNPRQIKPTFTCSLGNEKCFKKSGYSAELVSSNGKKSYKLCEVCVPGSDYCIYQLSKDQQACMYSDSQFRCESVGYMSNNELKMTRDSPCFGKTAPCIATRNGKKILCDLGNPSTIEDYQCAETPDFKASEYKSCE